MEEVSSSELGCVPLSALALLEHTAAVPYGGVTVSLCAVISRLSLIPSLSLCPNEKKKRKKKKRGVRGEPGIETLVLLKIGEWERWDGRLKT